MAQQGIVQARVKWLSLQEFTDLVSKVQIAIREFNKSNGNFENEAISFIEKVDQESSSREFFLEMIDRRLKKLKTIDSSGLVAWFNGNRVSLEQIAEKIRSRQSSNLSLHQLSKEATEGIVSLNVLLKVPTTDLSTMHLKELVRVKRAMVELRSYLSNKRERSDDQIDVVSSSSSVDMELYYRLLLDVRTSLDATSALPVDNKTTSIWKALEPKWSEILASLQKWLHHASKLISPVARNNALVVSNLLEIVIESARTSTSSQDAADNRKVEVSTLLTTQKKKLSAGDSPAAAAGEMIPYCDIASRIGGNESSISLGIHLTDLLELRAAVLLATVQNILESVHPEFRKKRLDSDAARKHDFSQGSTEESIPAALRIGRSYGVGRTS
jgi:hypothetical protein